MVYNYSRTRLLAKGPRDLEGGWANVDPGGVISSTPCCVRSTLCLQLIAPMKTNTQSSKLCKYLLSDKKKKLTITNAKKLTQAGKKYIKEAYNYRISLPVFSYFFTIAKSPIF